MRVPALLLFLVAVLSLSALGEDAASRIAAKNGVAMVRVRYLQPFVDRDGSVGTVEREALGVVSGGLVFIRGHVDSGELAPKGFRVISGDSSECPAEYLGKDPALNVCVLKPAKQLKGLSFDDSRRPSLGERVLVVLRRGKEDDYALEVSHAWVCSVLPGSPPAVVLDGVGIYDKAGAAVFDMKGRPLGVVGFDLSPAEGGPPGSRPGLPLLYPGGLLGALKPVRPRKSNPGTLGWSGALFGAVSPFLARRLGLKSGAALVTLVIPGSPADKGGLEALDVVTALNGKPLPPGEGAVRDFERRLSFLGAGGRASLAVLRGGKLREMELVLAARPPDGNTSPRTEIATFGLVVRQITWDVYVYRNLPWTLRGAVVDRVVSGSPADLAGLEAGDVIVSAGRQALDSPEKLSSLLDKRGNAPLLLEVRRGARRLFMKIERFSEEK